MLGMGRLISQLCIVAVVFASLTMYGQSVLSEPMDHTDPMASMELMNTGAEDCCNKHGKASIPGGDNCTVSCVAIASWYQVSLKSNVNQHELVFHADGTDVFRTRLKRPPKLIL